MTTATSSPLPSEPAAGSVGQAYLLFAVSLVLVLTLGVAVQLVSVTVGLAITEVLLILAPAVVFVRRKGLPVAQGLGWRPVPVADGMLALAVGVTGWGVAVGMVVLSEPVLGPPPEIPALEARSVPHLLWIVLSAAVLPGICEESLFRGAIQGVLRRRGRRWAVLVATLLFAVYHVNPWVFLPALFLGVVYGTLAMRTGSTLVPILAHVATNATAFTVPYFYREHPDPTAAYPLMALLAAGCLLTFPLAWWRTRGRDPAPPLLAAVPAGAGRLFPWLLGLAGAAVLLGLVALLIAGIALVGVHTVTDDDLEPVYQRGDHLILFKAGALPLDLEAGDVVVFDLDGQEVMGRLTAVGEEQVRVERSGVEHRLPRERVKAKVVHAVGELGGGGG